MATLKILVIQLTHINLLVENKWAATDSFSPLVWIVFSSPLSLYARELISKLLKLQARIQDLEMGGEFL